MHSLVQAIDSCQAQSNMMYTCITNSSTKEGRKRMTNEQRNYHVGDDCHYSLGSILFKFLMNKALVNNKKNGNTLLQKPYDSLSPYGVVNIITEQIN